MTLTRENHHRLLPILSRDPHARGKRSTVTCHLKCDDACTKPVPNVTDNSYFRDIAGRALSRRTLLGGAGAGALAILVAQNAAAPGAEAAAAQAASNLPFTAITPVDAAVDQFTVPTGYRWQPIIRWGDPLFSYADDFDADNQTAKLASRQFGYNNDYLDIIPINSRNKEALLVANHEYTNENIMFPPAADDAELAEQRRIGKASHGMSVVALRRKTVGQPWTYTIGHHRNRRITADTPFSVSGPAAGSASLRTKDDPKGTRILGTLGNCAGGTTPWGTVLSGEENFNGYFRTAGTSVSDKRYGLADKATTRGWEAIDPRFDARTAGYENEPNRFGWIVEVDPFEPGEAPVKHTALGRFKHEGANVILGRAATSPRTWATTSASTTSTSSSRTTRWSPAPRARTASGTSSCSRAARSTWRASRATRPSRRSREPARSRPTARSTASASGSRS
ncbi:hypothetical protein BC477_06020 [Clavibacter michiganensis subsp. michiganensis]|uniref:Phosphatase n=1 Tax=Clavibacter michiganensis subsp. michiganensis TaxID=33013 RepID=A0A251XLB2_CLAMM|nr:hypothetical protein BC477_06020 [Clavibacter michiganensis subsp. michiganensis]OUE04272.1 hypothetical protein CMMCAS07_04950 [Clavibacter michiganensis subsp. michiganensis]